MQLSNLIFTLTVGLLSCGFNTTVYAQNPPSEPTFESAFQAGISQYRDKKYDEARLSFTQALQVSPQSVQALTNLALAQFQLGKKGEAVALLRKAHALDPGFSTPLAALDFILPQLDVKEIPHEIQLWETVRSHFIVPFPLVSFLALTALSFFSSGWLFLQYFGRRQRALKEDKNLPSFPLIPTLILALFLGILCLTVLKVFDHEVPRGTITADKISVLSAPGENSAALFEIYSGLEVVLSTVSNDWVQVTYPGAMTGWVPKSAVLQTSGRSLW